MRSRDLRKLRKDKMQHRYIAPLPEPQRTDWEAIDREHWHDAQQQADDESRRLFAESDKALPPFLTQP